MPASRRSCISARQKRRQRLKSGSFRHYTPQGRKPPSQAEACATWAFMDFRGPQGPWVRAKTPGRTTVNVASLWSAFHFSVCARAFALPKVSPREHRSLKRRNRQWFAAAIHDQDRTQSRNWRKCACPGVRCGCRAERVGHALSRLCPMEFGAVLARASSHPRRMRGFGVGRTGSSSPADRVGAGAGSAGTNTGAGL